MSWGHRNTFKELMALVGETETWREKSECSMDSVGLERSKRSYRQMNMEQRGFLPPLPAGTKAAWGTGWNGTLSPTFFPKESQSQLGMGLRTSAYHLSYTRAILPAQTERDKHICNKELLDGAKELPRGNGPECASRGWPAGWFRARLGWLHHTVHGRLKVPQSEGTDVKGSRRTVLAKGCSAKISYLRYI